MIILTNQEIEQLEQLQTNGFNNGGIIYIKDEDTLYKIYDLPFFIEEKEKNIDYMLNKNYIKESGYPIEKIYNKETNKFIGFSQKYYKNSKNFRELIEQSNITHEYKIKIIKDIYKQIKEIHEHGIIIHDMHLDNMIANEKGHLIDLDEVTTPGNEMKFKQYYTIAKDKDTPFLNISTTQTDNIKAVINSLSIIYNYDFELEIVKQQNLKDFLEKHKNVFSKELYEYLRIIFELKETIYFDEILEDIKEDKIIRIRK